MCSIPQTDTGLMTQNGFKQPNTLEGKMKHDHVPTESNNRVFEVEPTADAIEHEDKLTFTRASLPKAMMNIV
jgi:hypothetical protein